jgi:enoyl-CoA hydratase
LDHLLSLDPAGKIAYMRTFFDLFKQIYYLPQPVIAAVNGPAMGGGFDLAVACDLRLCAPAAKFAETEILVGITQMVYPLYKIIGLSRAKELAMTGEPISADEAYRIGLVNHIFPAESLVDQAVALAEKLASRAKQALFETKRLSRDLIELNNEAGFQRMFQAVSDRLQSDEHREAAAHYVARLKQRNK